MCLDFGEYITSLAFGVIIALGDTIDFGVVVITDFDDLVSKYFGDIAGTLGVLFC